MSDKKVIDPRAAEVVTQMARKLQDDIASFGRYRRLIPKTVPQFRDIRNIFREIDGLIFAIQERLPDVVDKLPPNFGQWVVRQKLTSLAIFTDISHAFIRNPPIALTQSLGAFALLETEHASFTEVLSYFDMLVMEAGIDDKTADELDATRVKIEEVLRMIDDLLKSSPKVLQEF